MKKITKYRIVYEVEANPNYKGVKVTLIEAPDLWTVTSYYSKKFYQKFSGVNTFGEARIECDVVDEDAQSTYTHVLYREHRQNFDCESEYIAKDQTENRYFAAEAFLNSARSNSFSYISSRIEKRSGDYDFFTTDVLPSIIVEERKLLIKRFGVVSNYKTTYFNQIDEVKEFIKEQPFGCTVLRVNRRRREDPIYEEDIQYDDDDPNTFYSLNTKTEEAYYTEEYREIENLIEIELIGDNPVYFNDYNELRQYALSKFANEPSKDESNQVWIASECRIVTAKEQQEEDKN